MAHPVEAVVYVLFGVVFLANATGRMPGYHPTKPLTKALLGLASFGGFVTAALVLSGH
jgi:hypothetical protein